MFLSLYKLPFISLAIFQIQSSITIFNLVFPRAFVEITVSIAVFTLVALVVFEDAGEDVAVEEGLLTLDFGVVLPYAAEYGALAEEVVALAVLLALVELSNILVLVGILKIPHPMWHIIGKLTCIRTTILIHYPPPPMFNPLAVLSNIHKVINLILLIPIPMLDTLLPLTIIVELG